MRQTDGGQDVWSKNALGRRSGGLSWIDQFSLSPNEEGSKRGVTVLEGAGISS